MADTQPHPESNGLPAAFGSTAEQPASEHAVTNIAATISNHEIPQPAELKQSAQMPAPLESSSLVEPVQPAPNPEIFDSQPVQPSDPVPVTNGSLPQNHETEIPQVNGHQTFTAPALSPVQPTAPALSGDHSFSESVVPSSIPSEVPSSNPNGEPTDLASSTVLEPIVSPERAPISDLRTEPHSDKLAPETVAIIEERKHEEDNNADVVSEPAKRELSPLPMPASVQSIVATGLPSPPTQSTPPPAPEMTHAELPPQDEIPQPIDLAPIPVSEEKPADPAPTPAIPTQSAEDTVMEDAPQPHQPEPTPTDTATTVKIAREREEDAEEMEPAAKRMKTDEPQSADQPEFKIPEPPSAVSTTAPSEPSGAITVEGDNVVTPPRLAHMKKVISNLKKSKASTAFRVPVDYVTLNIPTYPDIVKQPMDLGTIDSKLKKNEYTSVQDFITDFELIVNNCIAFNGREHGVTQAAVTMQSSFNNQMANLPSVNEVEPTKAEKKAMKLKTEPIRTAPPRRPSITTPGSARSPKSAVTATTPSFAPGPDGIPLIRRDSNMVDGRPKRAIVPPKRNSDFSGARPKKKKYELQLRFCQEILKEIASPKHWQINQYFTHPVDPVALNIPTYFQVIKKPMDLGTVQQKLDQNDYEKAKDFEEDVRLVFKNCYKFNPEGDYINQVGHQLEELFDRKWATKDDWIAAREPQSDPQSEVDDDEEDEASEEDEADSEDDRNEKIKLLQAQIEAMSKQMGELTQSKKKKKATPPVDKKKSKSKPKKEKAAAQFPGLSKSKDKKKSSGKSKSDKDRYVTFQEKQYISNGIAMLPERQMQEALKIIQSSVPALANSNENEIELDIEEVPNHALLKLLNFVKKYAPPPPDEHEMKAESFSSAPTKSKKNKPMSKQEQEAQIEELRGRLGAYAGPVSPDAIQSVETGNDSSDDSADSEESEEE